MSRQGSHCSNRSEPDVPVPTCVDGVEHDLTPTMSAQSDPSFKLVLYACQREGCDFSLSRKEAVSRRRRPRREEDR